MCPVLFDLRRLYAPAMYICSAGAYPHTEVPAVAWQSMTIMTAYEACDPDFC